MAKEKAPQIEGPSGAIIEVLRGLRYAAFATRPSLRGLALKLIIVNRVPSAALDRVSVGALDLVTLNQAFSNGNLENSANLRRGEVRRNGGPNIGHGSALDGLNERGDIVVEGLKVGETLRIVALVNGRLAVVERVELRGCLLDGSGGVVSKDGRKGINVGVGNSSEEGLIGEVSHSSTFLFEKL